MPNIEPGTLTEEEKEEEEVFVKNKNVMKNKVGDTFISIIKYYKSTVVNNMISRHVLCISI